MHHNDGRSHLILNETDYIIPDGISQVDNRKPDILIGADYFWDLVEGKRGTRKDGLVVLNSKLGPIVTGMTMKNSSNEADETSGGRALPANQQQEIFQAWEVPIETRRFPYMWLPDYIQKLRKGIYPTINPPVKLRTRLKNSKKKRERNKTI